MLDSTKCLTKYNLRQPLLISHTLYCCRNKVPSIYLYDIICNIILK